MSQFGQQPQDGKISQYGSAAGDMILQHSLEIFGFSLLPPVTPGPKIVQNIVAQNRNFDGYQTGEKIVDFCFLREKPQKKHVDQNPGCPHQTEFDKTTDLVSLIKGMDSTHGVMFQLIILFILTKAGFSWRRTINYNLILTLN